MRPALPRSGIGVAWILLASPAMADDGGPPPAPGAAGAPIEVRIIGDKAGALQGTHGSGTVIGAREIERAQPFDLAEILRRVPGVQVRQEESAGLRFDVGIRGLDAARSRRVLMLEDGVPLQVNPYAEPDMYHPPAIERVRGIEVVKGSGSLLFGPQTIGGVINLLTLAPPSECRVKVELGGGSFGYARALASYGDAFRGVRYIVQAFHKQGNGIREEDFRADDLLAKVAFETSARGEATLKLGVHDERARSTQVGLTRPMFEADPRRPSFAPHDFLHVRRFEASFLHQQQLGPDTKLRTLVYAYTTRFSWRRQDYDRSLVPGTSYERIVGDTTVPGGALYFKQTNSIPDRAFDVAGIEPSIEQRVSTAGVLHTMSAGARFLVEFAHRAQRAGQSPQSDAGDLLLDERHRSLAFAAYVQDQIAFRDDLLVTLGLRFEHADYLREVNRQVVGSVPEDVSIRGESHVNELIPGIGATYGSADRHLFAGLHVGFAPPRATVAIATTGQDQELDSERSLNYELGARVALKKWLELEATGFLSNFENQVLPQGRSFGEAILVNAGQTRHVGAEAAALFGVGAALGLGLRVDLGASYTLAQATFVGGPNAGKLVPYSPLHSASATVDVEHPWGIGGQVALSYVGSQLTDQGNTEAVDVTGRLGRMAPRGLIDLGVRYREGRTGLEAGLGVKNLLDTVYVVGRRPDGIFTGGFRQITLGLRWAPR